VALIALGSAKGSPGVTSTALALTLQWPRNALLVDADLAGSGIMSGFFRGQLSHDHGLQPLAIAHSHGELESRLWEETVPIVENDSTKLLLPGLTSPVAAPAVSNMWASLGNQLAALERTGTDVIVDLGRLAWTGDDRESLLAVADQVLVTTGSRLPDVVAARGLATQRLRGLDPTARELANLSVLTIGPGRPYQINEIRDVLGVPDVGHVAWDPVTAEVFSVGATVNARRYQKSPLLRSLRPVIDQIMARVQHRRTRFSTAQEVR
jgi:hypothetical protein